jgi:hypothetical protein
LQIDAQALWNGPPFRPASNTMLDIRKENGTR